MRPKLPKSFVLAQRRERIIRGCAEACMEEGVQNLNVAKIVAAAEIARDTFYKTFDNKEHCYDAAFHFAVSLAEESVIDAEPHEMLTNLVELVENERALAWLVLVDGPAGARGPYEELTARFADFSGLDPTMSTLTVGGVMGMLARHLRDPEPDILDAVQAFVAPLAHSIAVPAS